MLCEPLPPEYDPGARLAALRRHRAQARRLDRALRIEHGVNLTGVAILRDLAAAPMGRLPRRSLAHHLGLSFSAISLVLLSLEAKRLVDRHQHRNDDRVALAAITPPGLQALAGCKVTLARHLAAGKLDAQADSRQGSASPSRSFT